MSDSRSYGFIKAIQFTLPWETGKDKDGNLRADGGIVTDTGGVTKYGISSKANPDVDIANLTVDSATDIYQFRYWDIYTTLKPTSANLDSLPVALAVAVFDAGVNCGVSRSVGWLGKALEARTPYKAFNDLRGGYYFSLVASDRAKYGPYMNGWTNRLTDLKKYCDVLEQDAQNSFNVYDLSKAKGDSDVS